MNKNEIYQDIIPSLIISAEKEGLSINIENDNLTNGRYFQFGGCIGETATFVAIVDVVKKETHISRHIAKHKEEFIQENVIYEDFTQLINKIIKFIKENI